MDSIEVSKIGVVEVVDSVLYVNSEDILEELLVKIACAGYKKTDAGAFAAKVTISVFMLGDEEEK